MAAGKGGDGISHFWAPVHGPDGGNGGRGGHVYIKVDPQVRDLRHLQDAMAAKPGKKGGRYDMTGARGEKLTINVPPGTAITNAMTGDVLLDLLAPERRPILFLKGGRGGKGNKAFATPTNRAPTECTEGSTGEFGTMLVQLKAIADIGLIGYPNAGKSSFLAAISRSRTDISPRPFTTLRPWLANVKKKNAQGEEETVRFADLPGLIQGAAMNRGLGLQFLQHCERVKAIVYYLAFGPSELKTGDESRSPVEIFRILKQELREYGKSMHERACCVIINKMDMEDDDEIAEQVKLIQEETELPVFPISAEYLENVDEVTDWLVDLIINREWKPVGTIAQVVTPVNHLTKVDNYLHTDIWKMNKRLRWDGPNDWDEDWDDEWEDEWEAKALINPVEAVFDKKLPYYMREFPRAPPEDEGESKQLKP
eukprot:TRINITY_DN61226_c0_g1_i1.p1 TRINITY_DN61226_c0_g1~~TRINITY_DN61226_c0_g1_i1.p1  ORF type:complete len:470 (-),score=53.37 TRINITY_DN61226_c0_g1_i1:27-1301(-)